MLVIDPGRELNAVREARRLGIPVVGVLDSDCDPSLVDIVIPGNDDALKSVRLLLDRLVSAVEEGGANRQVEAAAVGDSKTAEADFPADEPRPTRGKRAADLKPRKPAPEAPAPAAPAPEAAEAEAGATEAGGEATESVAAKTGDAAPE